MFLPIHFNIQLMYHEIVPSVLYIAKSPEANASGLISVPKGIRTPDPRLRRPLLYPAELWTRMSYVFMTTPRVGLEPTTARLTAACSTD